MTQDAPLSWLLLIHHFPRDPGSLRVKVWRRLQSVGAIAIKNSVYVLPNSDETREDFEWVLREIQGGSAEAVILEARFVDGMDDREVRALFDAARDADYAALADDARALDAAGREELAPALQRLRKRLSEVEAIDFFGASGRETAAGLIEELAARLAAPVDSPREGERMQQTSLDDLKGKVWVTRRNVHVDRISTAWLIRRFIDPGATFKFTDRRTYAPAAGEIRFDMYEAEFTHEGSRCTFEVLLRHTGIDDPALQRVAEVVHDIDLKENQYAHAETPGIATLIAGISALDDDMARIERGAAMFDDLYQSAKVR